MREKSNLSKEEMQEKYQFINGDGIEAANEFEDRSIDLLLTDPPYCISIGNPEEEETKRSKKIRIRNRVRNITPRINFGHWDFVEDPFKWTKIVIPKIAGWVVIFCAKEQIGKYQNILKNNAFISIGTFVWQKTNANPLLNRTKPLDVWHVSVTGKRPGTKFNGKMVNNIFTCYSPMPYQRIHPTQKPLPLFERLVELFSSEGDLVFDPFAGSATTVVACKNLNRRIIAYEKDAENYKKAQIRLEEHRGLFD